MPSLLDDFADRHDEAVVRRGGEIFVAVEVMDEFISEVERRGVRILGLEGFLIADDATYPSLDRIADFSDEHDAGRSARWARELIHGDWRAPPRPGDAMHSAASGRYMLVVVLDATAR